MKKSSYYFWGYFCLICSDQCHVVTYASQIPSLPLVAWICVAIQMPMVAWKFFQMSVSQIPSNTSKNTCGRDSKPFSENCLWIVDQSQGSPGLKICTQFYPAKQQVFPWSKILRTYIYIYLSLSLSLCPCSNRIKSKLPPMFIRI